jgi:predicted CXXCH cytochrome family protein
LVLVLSAVVQGYRKYSPTRAATGHRAVKANYVGSNACADCHATQTQAWIGSQHARSLQEASPATLLGRVDGRELHYGNNRSLIRREGDAFHVRSEGADGKPVDVPLTHVIGLAPLQQYLVSLPDGRKQSLGISWDSRDKAAGGQRWFHLFPNGGTNPGQPLHWAGIDQNWNYQCADCHSTNLRKGYDAATDQFKTTWSEISVGCEACHGPGSAHVAWAQSPEKTQLPNYGLSAQLDERHQVHWQTRQAGTAARSVPRQSNREIEVCARCHARRGQFSDEYRAGDPLLDHFRPALLLPGLYHDDGQQRDEVYNYASFLQSRMHAVGVTCSDCHEPHGGKLRAAGNAVCAQCHAPATFDTPAHHHHRAGNRGAECVVCHAPVTTYMSIDARHDHSFRIPRPDRSGKLGTPDACTQCHAKQTPSWAAGYIRTWYPQPKPGFQDFAETFAAIEAEDPAARAEVLHLLIDAKAPVVTRASALARLVNHPALIDSNLLNAAYNALSDADGMVRAAAIGLVANAPVESRVYHLAPLLSDPLRLVRIDAARALAGPAESRLDTAQQAAFGSALAEYIAAQQFNADRPEAQSNLALLYIDKSRLIGATESRPNGASRRQ